MATCRRSREQKEYIDHLGTLPLSHMQSEADTERSRDAVSRSGKRSRTMYDDGIETRRHRQDGASADEGEKFSGLM